MFVFFEQEKRLTFIIKIDLLEHKCKTYAPKIKMFHFRDFSKNFLKLADYFLIKSIQLFRIFKFNSKNV